jgi:hypothetical protein
MRDTGETVGKGVAPPMDRSHPNGRSVFLPRENVKPCYVLV